jgi:hypothetical protein
LGRPRRRLDDQTLERLAAEGREFLREIDGLGRSVALATRARWTPPDQAYGSRDVAELVATERGSLVVPSNGGDDSYVVLDPEWLAEYGLAAKITFGVLTEAEMLAAIRGNRRLALFMAPVVGERLRSLPRSSEPDELEAARGFLEQLADAIYPRTHGRHSEWDRAAVDELFRQRLDVQRAAQATYRRSGQLPGSQLLPVIVDDKATTMVTIEDASWPAESAWRFLEAFLGASRRTLERRRSPQQPPARQRKRKPRRRT